MRDIKRTAETDDVFYSFEIQENDTHERSQKGLVTKYQMEKRMSSVTGF